MVTAFSGTISIEGVSLPYRIEASPFFSGHDVRVVVRALAPDRARVEAAARSLSDLVVAGSAPPITESITVLREGPSEYIVKIMVPMRAPVWAYTEMLQAYVSAHVPTQ